MKKKYLIPLIVLVVVVIVVVGKIALGPAPFASAYTKIALKKNFSTAYLAHTKPNPGTSPGNIANDASQNAANVMVYVMYACEDYQAGHISKTQLLQVMQNTKPAIDYITSLFNQNYPTVMTYPTINESRGLSYVETESDGSQQGSTVNFVKLQPKIFDLLTQMYQSQDPNTIIQDMKQFGVYMEQGSFYFEFNTQYGLEQINVGSFKPEWILKNVNETADSVQECMKTWIKEDK